MVTKTILFIVTALLLIVLLYRFSKDRRNVEIGHNVLKQQEAPNKKNLVSISAFLSSIEGIEDSINEYLILSNMWDDLTVRNVNFIFYYAENYSDKAISVFNSQDKRQSYFIKKGFNIIEITWMLKNNFDSAKNQKLYYCLKDASTKALIESYITLQVSVYCDSKCIKLVNCEFSEFFSIFANLIFIKGSSVLMFFETMPPEDKLENFRLSLNTATLRTLDLVFLSLDLTQSNLKDTFTKTNYYNSFLKDIIKDKFSNYKISGDSESFFVATVIQNMSNERDVDLVNELHLNLNDFF